MNQRTYAALLAVVAVLIAAGLLPLDASSTPASRQQLGLSLGLAAGSALLSIAVGLPLAVAVARFPNGGKRLAWFVILLLLVAPLYVHLAGWDAVGGWLGWFG